MKTKLLLSLALVLIGGLVGCLSTSKPTSRNTAASLQNQLEIIEQKIPEIESVGMAIPPSGLGWYGEECASAAFMLRGNRRFHAAGEFPRAPPPVPYIDVIVTIVRYVSSGDAQEALEKSLRWRPGAFQPKATYKEATLHKYQGTSGAVSTAMCQSGPYIVEINANSEGASPLVMKVLDVVLSELDAAASKSK